MGMEGNAVWQSWLADIVAWYLHATHTPTFLKSDGKFSVGLHMASASFLTQPSGNHYLSIRIGTKDGTYLLLRQRRL